MSVISQLFHIGGNSKGGEGCNVHILLRDIEEDPVILSDDLDLIRMQKDGKLAENFLILVFLPNKYVKLFDQQFDFSDGALIIIVFLHQRFHILLQSDDLFRFYRKMEKVRAVVSRYLGKKQGTVFFSVTTNKIDQQQRVSDSRRRGDTDKHTANPEYFSDDNCETDTENNISQRAYRQSQPDPLDNQIVRGEQIQDADKGGAKRCYSYADHDPFGEHGICNIQKSRHKRSDDHQNRCDDNTLDNGGFVCQGEAGTKSAMVLFSNVNAENRSDSLTDAVKE